MENIKPVELPDRVTVRVDELSRLRQQAAMLAALYKVGVKSWIGYKAAVVLSEKDEQIIDIRLGWSSVLDNRIDQK